MLIVNRSPCVSCKSVNPASPYDPTTPINAVKRGQFTIPIIKTDHMVCIDRVLSQFALTTIAI